MGLGDKERGQGWLYVHIISKDFTMVLVGWYSRGEEEKGMWGGGGGGIIWVQLCTLISYMGSVDSDGGGGGGVLLLKTVKNRWDGVG